jgi:hypothetical protein
MVSVESIVRVALLGVSLFVLVVMGEAYDKPAFVASAMRAPGNRKEKVRNDIRSPGSAHFFAALAP